MGYVLKAVLSSAQHPEYGQITVPFPIPDEKYDRMIELLEPLEIGDALRQDCRVDELDSFYTVLNRLVGSLVNFDELDYGDGRSALKPEASQMVLKRWGFKRTNFVLANTIERLGPYKEQLSAENQEWQKKAYVPPDDAHNRYFEVDTALAYLDAFISQVREAYGKLELFGPEHCEPNSYESLDYEGRVLVLSPDTLKESCWTPQNQLWPMTALDAAPTLSVGLSAVPAWAMESRPDGTAQTSPAF